MGLYFSDMKLFTFEGYKLNISEEALCIKAFRELFKRDRSKTKEKALLELGFIYFYLDPRSDYSFLTDDEERMEAIIEQEGFPTKWKPDDKVQRAMEVYKSLTQTSSSLLLQDTRISIDKARAFLRNLDLEQKDDNGKPIYTINSYLNAIKDVPKLIKELSEAEKAVSKELEENGKLKANRLKKVGEDGLDSFLNKK